MWSGGDGSEIEKRKRNRRYGKRGRGRVEERRLTCRKRLR